MHRSAPHEGHAVLEASIEIESSRQEVWAHLADLPRMARWSPQVMKLFVRTPGPVAIGTRTLNVNRHRMLIWVTRAQVVELDPEVRLAFRIRDNRTVWVYELAEIDSRRTRLTHRRETPDGIHERALRLEDRWMGGVPKFEQTLEAGMRQTLRRIKADVERR